EGGPAVNHRQAPLVHPTKEHGRGLTPKGRGLTRGDTLGAAGQIGRGLTRRKRGPARPTLRKLREGRDGADEGQETEGRACHVLLHTPPHLSCCLSRSRMGVPPADDPTAFPNSPRRNGPVSS